MLHPLADLDGKRKYVFSSGAEDFYLKVVTSPQEARRYTDAIVSLENIRADSEVQLQSDIISQRRTIPSIYQGQSVEEMAKSIAKFPAQFGDEKNKTMFLLENEGGEFVTAILLTINDPHQRELLKTSPEVGTLIEVSDISTNERYRGRNLFSGAFDKILTMLSNNEKRSLATPIQYSVSMTATTAIDIASREEFEYVRNLSRYANMWQERFYDNQLQNRRVSQDEKIGLDRMPLAQYLTEDGARIDDNKIDVLIKDERRKVFEEGKGETVRGLYLEGTSPEYAVIKERRKTLIENRADKGIYRKPKQEAAAEDAPETSASSSSAVAVMENHPRSKWH